MLLGRFSRTEEACGRSLGSHTELDPLNKCTHDNTKNRNQDPTIAYKALHHQVPDSLSFHLLSASVSCVPAMLCPMLFLNYHTLLPLAICHLSALETKFFIYTHISYSPPYLKSNITSSERPSRTSYYHHQPSTLSLLALILYITYASHCRLYCCLFNIACLAPPLKCKLHEGNAVSFTNISGLDGHAYFLLGFVCIL